MRILKNTFKFKGETFMQSKIAIIMQQLCNRKLHQFTIGKKAPPWSPGPGPDLIRAIYDLVFGSIMKW